MNRIRELQVKRNAESRQAWPSFAEHRAEVTRRILDAAAQRNGALCVLGAGNCNELDLPALLPRFEQIHLVDLDGEALRAGLARQAISSPRVQLHPDVDVTGVAAILSGWSPTSPAGDEEVDQCLAAARHATPLPELKCSVTASACLLSQLVEGIILTLGEGHPRFLDLLTCIRRRHCELLLELTAPGGMAILFTDVVSSLTCPAILEAGPQLPAVLWHALQTRNFFTGTNPFILRELLRSDPRLQPLVEDVQLSNPWLWNLGPRVYAVCALTARRSPSE